MKIAVLSAPALMLIVASVAAAAAPVESDPFLCKRGGDSMTCTAFDKDGHWDAFDKYQAPAVSVNDVQMVLTPNGYNHTKAVLTFRYKSATVPHGDVTMHVNLYRAHVPIATFDSDLPASGACESDYVDGAKQEQNLYANYFSLAGVPTEIVISTSMATGTNATKC
jgi:energy-converting hydrogenase Eha subunit E